MFGDCLAAVSRPGDHGLSLSCLARWALQTQTTARTGDGGVDVIAVDPDPIRGGRMVIQVKRYDSTIPPSVVRDLYGTVLHEGAIEGILVTTAGFGPSSHQFAQGKPLTLINGKELLALLAKHGLAAGT
jgi:restriction system protein